MSMQLIASTPTPFGMGFNLALAVNEYGETGDPTSLIMAGVGLAGGAAMMINPCGLIAKAFSGFTAISSGIQLAVSGPDDPFRGFHIAGVLGGALGFLRLLRGRHADRCGGREEICV